MIDSIVYEDLSFSLRMCLRRDEAAQKQLFLNNDSHGGRNARACFRRANQFSFDSKQTVEWRSRVCVSVVQE